TRGCAPATSSRASTTPTSTAWPRSSGSGRGSRPRPSSGPWSCATAVLSTSRSACVSRVLANDVQHPLGAGVSMRADTTSTIGKGRPPATRPRGPMRVLSVWRPKPAAVAAAVLGAVFLPQPLLAWGFTAHRMVNAKAIATLPEPLAAFFDGNRAYVVEHAIDPDLWRESGRPDEGPNHYLDLDAFGAFPFPDVPRSEAEHLARHGAAAVQPAPLP